MTKLFVDKIIEIEAEARKIWDVLTNTEYTKQWASEFTNGTEFYIDSDWKLGSPVRWKSKDGTVLVEGNVTAVKPNNFLRFTVFDVRSERPPVTEEDGITYKLTEQNGKTKLEILQGDFSAMVEGEKYRNLSTEIWDRVLLKVKKLSEI